MERKGDQWREEESQRHNGKKGEVHGAKDEKVDYKCV